MHWCIIATIFSVLLAVSGNDTFQSRAPEVKTTDKKREFRKRVRNRPVCPNGDNICFLFEGVSGVRCETMSFYLEGYSSTTPFSYSYSLANVGSNIPDHENIGLDYDWLNNYGSANYVFIAKVNAPGCESVHNKCLLDCAPGGPPQSPYAPPYCDEIPCSSQNGPTPTISPPTAPNPIISPPPVPSPSSPCPSTQDIWFMYEGVTGQVCETMSFFLHSPQQYESVSYSYSLAGSGSNIEGNTNIGLTAAANPLINAPGAGNYIFVAKVDVPGCATTMKRCVLDCVPGEPVRSENDPPYCDGAASPASGGSNNRGGSNNHGGSNKHFHN
mmetsp:Transcript_53377/g.64330  ORF Transcript_53377/g.64330 Transcript_53377/m.64330 type:complete len:328 (+) Transcript_53377:54-1037(+)